jgi:hypothetical protein
MRFEVGQIWHNGADRTVQAKVIAVTDDGLHATLRRITHGLGTFQLDVSAIVAGLQIMAAHRSPAVKRGKGV